MIRYNQSVFLGDYTINHGFVLLKRGLLFVKQGCGHSCHHRIAPWGKPRPCHPGSRRTWLTGKQLTYLNPQLRPKSRPDSMPTPLMMLFGALLSQASTLPAGAGGGGFPGSSPFGLFPMQPNLMEKRSLAPAPIRQVNFF